jgi:hypothetical protein
MDVWRPADPVESALSWACALERADGPSSLLFSRQAVPFVTRSDAQVAAIRRGAYVLRDAEEAVAVILATGSELGLALEARDLLAADGIAVRVVSMPSTTVFDRQDVTYKRKVLPDNLPRVAVEAGVSDFWWKYRCDAVVGIDRYRRVGAGAGLFELSASRPRTSPTPCALSCARAADAFRTHRAQDSFDRLRGLRHDHPCSNQRLRPYRPQHPSCPLRGRQETRRSRSLRSTTSATPGPMRT